MARMHQGLWPLGLPERNRQHRTHPIKINCQLRRRRRRPEALYLCVKLEILAVDAGQVQAISLES
jgi:hypothetical protein